MQHCDLSSPCCTVGPFSDKLQVELYVSLVVSSHRLTHMTHRQQGGKRDEVRSGGQPRGHRGEGGGGKPR